MYFHKARSNIGFTKRKTHRRKLANRQQYHQNHSHYARIVRPLASKTHFPKQACAELHEPCKAKRSKRNGEKGRHGAGAVTVCIPEACQQLFHEAIGRNIDYVERKGGNIRHGKPSQAPVLKRFRNSEQNKNGQERLYALPIGEHKEQTRNNGLGDA